MATTLAVCIKGIDLLHASVDGACEELAKTIAGKLPAASMFDNRLLLKDQALYMTFVQSVDALHNGGYYAQAQETLALHRSYDSSCGPLSRSSGMSRLKRMRAAARLAIGVEWALTKVRGLKPKNKDEIVASAKDILGKLSKKGLKLTDLPVYLQGVLMSMSKHAPVEDKPVPVMDAP
jgi:hypothetical protein